MINARSFKTSRSIVSSHARLLDMAVGAIDSSIDGHLQHGRTAARCCRPASKRPRPGREGCNHEVSANFRAAALNTEFIVIDFDAIQMHMRTAAQLPCHRTSWTLSEEIDALRCRGALWMRHNFGRMLSSCIGGRRAAATLEDACAKVPTAAN